MSMRSINSETAREYNYYSKDTALIPSVKKKYEQIPKGCEL